MCYTSVILNCKLLYVQILSSEVWNTRLTSPVCHVNDGCRHEGICIPRGWYIRRGNTVVIKSHIRYMRILGKKISFIYLYHYIIPYIYPRSLYQGLTLEDPCLCNQAIHNHLGKQSHNDSITSWLRANLEQSWWPSKVIITFYWCELRNTNGWTKQIGW